MGVCREEWRINKEEKMNNEMETTLQSYIGFRTWHD